MIDINEWCYHGTNKHNSSSIIKSKKFLIDKKHVGSLGIGAYLFPYSCDNAFNFSKNRNNLSDEEVGIVKLKLNNEYTDKIVDFTDFEFISRFEKFVQNNKTKIKMVNNKYSKTHKTGYSNISDGLTIEMFIEKLKKDDDFTAMGVLNLTSNNINGFVMNKTMIANTYELAVRDNKLIKENSMVKLS